MGSAAGDLERHPSLDERFDPAIRIVASDPAWSARAEEELSSLAEALAAVAVRVEHIGSTAVPGLDAKPIIDLQLSVAAIEPRERYVAPLERLGYLFVPDPESPDLRFFAKPAERPRSHHLHVCETGSEHEFRHLALRRGKGGLRQGPRSTSRDVGPREKSFLRLSISAAPVRG